jgi:PAS domain S-box-containing protein
VKKPPAPRTAHTALRRRAEAQLKARKPRARSEADTQKLLHELQVHQIELELQNEELRTAREALERALADYTGLYDFAPVGYLTLDPSGVIRRANLTAATLLGVARSRLLKQRFGRFVVPQGRAAFNALLARFFSTKAPEEADVQLQVEGQPPRTVHVRTAALEDGQECQVVLTDLTRRIQMQEELRRSERLFRLAFEESPVGRCLVGADGRIGKTNHAFCALLGRSQQELAGLNFLEITHPEDRQASAEGVRQLLEGTLVRLDLEKRYLTAEQQTVWASVRVGLLRDEAGSPLHFSVYVQDITERKRAEAALLEREEQLRRSEVLLNHTQRLSKAGGWEWDAIRQTMVWTEETYRLHGLKSEDFAPGSKEHIRRSAGCYAPEHQATILEAFRRCMERGEAYDLEVPFTNAAGRRMWVRTTAEAVWDGDRVVKVLGNLMDITERKQAEEDLRASKARLEAVFRVVPTGVGIVAHRILIEVNERVLEMTGYSREELVGANARLLYPTEEEYLYVGREKYRQIATHGTGIVETRWRRKDGLVRDVLLSSTPLDPADLALGVVFTALDITERKRAEEELAGSRAALRALTARLEAIREQERQNLAREIHDTFGHALTEWKFDLAWLGRRLTEEGLGGRTALRRKLAAMSRRAEAEMESVRRIAGELRPALLDTVGLPPAIEWLARDFQVRTRIRSRADLPSVPLALAPTHATALYRVLQELLVNVARHAQARAVDIRLTSGADWLELRVRDDGCGISPRAAANPTSLGLLGIRERVAALGGAVVIRGVRGKGTTATVRLPLTTPPSPD